jgi:thiol-disulfide isomerase/thioredoxin
MDKRYLTATVGLAGVILLVAGIALFLRGRDRETAPVDIQQASGESGIVTDDSDIVVQLLRDPVDLPAFTLTDLEGKTTSSADLKGKVVLVNFWATWCGPCRAEIPDLVELQDKYRDHLVIVGVSEDEGGVDPVKRFAAEQKMNYPIVMSNAEIRKVFPGVMALPTTFVIDRDGKMVQKHVGLLMKAPTEAATRVLAGLNTNARVERIADPSKLDIGTATAQVMEIPGVNMSKVPAAQRASVLQALNSQSCTCGCGLTVAKCRVDDPTCPVSLPLALKTVETMAPPPPGT